MLTHLYIRNFAVVSQLDISFDQGLTVISGETGAGKSITVDALGLALGDRADPNIVRNGTAQAEIIATFDTQNQPYAAAWLVEQALDNDDCIVRRVINAEGRSRAFVNGTPVTLQQLKAFGELMMDIHSQHEHQSLLRKDAHRSLLDNFAGALGLSQQVEDLYRRWQQASDALETLKSQLNERSARVELLDYQLDELNRLGLQDNELETLEQEHQRLTHAGDIIAAGQAAATLCAGDTNDSGENANNGLSLITQARRLLDDINDEDSGLVETRSLLESSAIQLEEAALGLHHYLERIEINPQRLAEAEERLSEIHRIARKHNIHPAELIELHRQLQAEQESIGGIDDKLAELEQSAAELSAEYASTATQLSEKRRFAASKLDQEVMSLLGGLGMPGSQFQTCLTPKAATFSSHGAEDIEFHVSANPGQPPKALNKVASGGELSRISLALQVINAQRGKIPILVFDEVDVGIGGATAETVGRLLRTLGENGQVLCVTHQPQVAAHGHHHFRAEKAVSADATNSSMLQLDKEQKVEEVARMLGGAKLTEQSIAHARQMLNGSAETEPA